MKPRVRPLRAGANRLGLNFVSNGCEPRGVGGDYTAGDCDVALTTEIRLFTRVRIESSGVASVVECAVDDAGPQRWRGSSPTASGMLRRQWEAAGGGAERRQWGALAWRGVE